MKVLLILVLSFLSLNAYCWSGYKYSNYDSVEIESGTLVRPGEEIELYNYDQGEYEYVYVDNISSYGFGAEIEITDSEGNYDTLDMD